MASNIFGTPVTTEMLKAMPEYHDKESITQRDQAIVALDTKNAEGKDVNARKFVENLQARFGEGKVSTMCLIYNATGYTATFVEARDWIGRVCESPYPTIIANGQWGAFLHGQSNDMAKESRAGIVYSAVPNSGIEHYWFIGFSNSMSGASNQVHTEIHNSVIRDWNAIDNQLSSGGVVHLTNDQGGYSIASIGNTATPVFEAIMTLPGIVTRKV